jgi:hypothetical protein
MPHVLIRVLAVLSVLAGAWWLSMSLSAGVADVAVGLGIVAGTWLALAGIGLWMLRELARRLWIGLMAIAIAVLLYAGLGWAGMGGGLVGGAAAFLAVFGLGAAIPIAGILFLRQPHVKSLFH